MKSLNPEIIRATTPVILAMVGAIIGICVVLSESISDAKSAAAFGLAGTAIAGAAGLAQTSKSEPDSASSKDREIFKADRPTRSIDA